MQQADRYYQIQVTETETALKRIRKIVSWFYLVRLITFLLFLVFFILFLQHGSNFWYLVLSGLGLILFLVAVKYDLILGYREKFLAHKLSINKDELNFLDFRYAGHETGEEFRGLNPHLAADFEIFGDGSLYQYLNRCSTTMGKKKLAAGLTDFQSDSNVIYKKQQAVNELAGKTEFIQNFRVFGRFISETGTELPGLQVWLAERAEKLRLLQALAIVIPPFNITWFALVGIGLIPLNSAILPLLASILIIFLHSKKINRAHSKLGKTAKTIEKYTSLIKLVENESFTDDYSNRLKQQFLTENSKASQSLSSLFKLLNRFDIRLNVVVSFILNSLVIFDIQVLILLGKWKKKHKNSLTNWFEALSEMDALISLATFAFNNQEHVAYPGLSDGDFVFQAAGMGHPLLSPEVRVNNSLVFNGTPSVLIVTGANMAGKSTFLRTVSVNLILAMNGAPVCAKSFLFTPCHIMSSIKIQDSLYQNESYFYAELLRIKEIIEHTKSGQRTLVILDEILRGTNTKDKQLGSMGLLENLISQKSVVMVATHDLTLGELEKIYPGFVTNYCFEVELANDQLIFDYKLKKGISQKLNASFLMKKMGIIE